MMVRHAEQRAREAAANADRYLRETFPRANATTLALALKEFNNDVALAKDALKEFFEEEDGGGGRGRRRGRRARRGRAHRLCRALTMVAGRHGAHALSF